MLNIVVFKRPNILAECGGIPFCFIFEAGDVGIVARFECVFCKANVSFCFRIVLPCYSRLVHNAAGEAIILQWTLLFVSAVAIRLRALLGFIFVQDGFIVSGYDLAYVRHTAVT